MMPLRDKARGLTLFYCLSALATCKRTQHCWVRPFAHPVAHSILVGVVAQSLKLVKRLSQQLPTFLLFRISKA